MRSSQSAIFRNIRVVAGLLAAVFAGQAAAQDHFLFMANTASTVTKPNIMIAVDNSANWSRSSQQWPDSNGNQGEAELLAIKNVLTSLTIEANVGFMGYSGSGSNLGAYIRYGVRDMTVPANKTALINILDHIRGDVNSSIEKVNSSDESLMLFEAYKYFKRLTPYRGNYQSGNNPASNVDTPTNMGNPSGMSPKGQGLTDNFALSANTGGTYTGAPAGSCGNNYLIFIINNSNGAYATGSQTYGSSPTYSAGASLGTLTASTWMDEWARTLYQSGTSVFILDAFNAQQNTAYSQAMERAANVAGGSYYVVKNQAQIELAFKDILAQINGVNSNFASAALPINSANRSESLNQVYIGMFRPNTGPDPRWMGNLKRYQLTKSGTKINLADQLGAVAVDNTSGFVTACAASYWTTGSGNYWETTKNNAATASTCTAFPTVNTVLGATYSDVPDGPTVEKGGVAQVLRRGNNPPTTTTTTNYQTVTRTMFTYAAGQPGNKAALTASNTGTTWSTALYNWVLGFDDDTAVTASSVTSYPYSDFVYTVLPHTPDVSRPSIHGDVVHNVPVAINYSASATTTIYYGANDGLFRAVDAATGREKWAFMHPEHGAKMQRLRDNSPPINFPNVSASLNPLEKDYFFDGGTGVYQALNDTAVWIYPSMRRGGRMIYGINVTDSDNPSIGWRVGCPNLTNDTGCTTGFDKIGQTWSAPVVAFIKGYSTTNPVVIFGGGYDACEDANMANPTCPVSPATERKGGRVYVVDALTGALLKEFTTGISGSIVADIAVVDANNDGFVDFGYAVSTRGEVIRMDFVDPANWATVKTCSTSACAWVNGRISVAGGGRKFLHQPALLRAGSKVYVAFGSGDREHPLSTNYPYVDSISNRFYVYLDDISTAAPTTPINLDSDVNMRNFSNASAATCTSEKVLPTGTLKGWRMNLPNRGEQTVTSALIAAGMVTFGTNRSLGTGTSCVNPLGEARGYWVNLLNASGAIGVGSATCGGDRSSIFTGGGFPTNAVITTVPIGGKDETVVIGAPQRTGGSSVPIDPQQLKPGITSKRKSVYWKSNRVE